MAAAGGAFEEILDAARVGGGGGRHAIDVWPSAEGGDAKVIGSGLGAVVSGEAVVAEAAADGAVSLSAVSRAFTV